MTLPQFLTSVVVILVIMHVLLLGVAYGILLERKIAAWAQDRIGPNRVGPWGLLQPIADGLKFVFKEDYNPGAVEKGLFIAAPVLAVVPAMLGWAVIPWGGAWAFPGMTLPAGLPLVGGMHVDAFTVDVSVTSANIGVIYILAIGSLAAYGVTVGGWAANNKYTFLGGLRASAQILSYEIPMGLCVLCVLLLAGTAQPDQIIGAQVGYWYGFIPAWFIFQQPLAAILFFVCILAESNRAPFDVAECEQELVGGFHTEYSSMKFALFFLGEYMHMATAGAFLAILFLGGWHLPWVDYALYGGPQPMVAGLAGVLLKMAVFLGKALLLVALMMWVRWTLPRFRFDQIMSLAWRSLIPLALLLLLTSGFFVWKGWTDQMWAGNLAVAAIGLIFAPLLPKGPAPNRRVGLAGSRFSPPAVVAPDRGP